MPRQIKRKRPQDLNGSKLKAGQQRATPGQAIVATHVPETKAPTCRHPHLEPLTLTALMDAFKLNGIYFSAEMDGSYECHARAWTGGYGLSCPDEGLILRRTINPFDGAEVLQFFKDVVCPR